MEGLACCAAVTYVNGALIGDPLDVKMFQATQWILDEGSGRGTVNSANAINTDD